MNQLDLFPAVESAVDLTAYDRIIVNTSGGKDSQATLDFMVRLASAAGVFDRVSAVHCDLGDAEWDGTTELAAKQVAAYGLPPLAIVRKIDTEAAPADLLERVEKRGMWPSSAARWCTSDYKRGPARKHYTAVSRDHAGDGPCRILSVLGLRAEESAARARKVPFTAGVVETRNQVVDEWFPILDWSEADVWSTIRESGVDYHPAYDAGMSRLSCKFCVLASKDDLVLSARLNPETAAAYAAVEVKIGHTFKKDLSMTQIIAAAEERNKL